MVPDSLGEIFQPTFDGCERDELLSFLLESVQLELPEADYLTQNEVAHQMLTTWSFLLGAIQSGFIEDGICYEGRSGFQIQVSQNE